MLATPAKSLAAVKIVQIRHLSVQVHDPNGLKRGWSGQVTGYLAKCSLTGAAERILLTTIPTVIYGIRLLMAAGWHHPCHVKGRG